MIPEKYNLIDTEENDFYYYFERRLDESLYFKDFDKFKKQIDTLIPNFFKKYVERWAGNDVYVKYEIFKDYPINKFIEILDICSYRIARKGIAFVLIRPEHDIVEKFDNLYIHLSKIDNLDRIGIKCKSSGKFEEYKPRIFLYPIKSVLNGIVEDWNDIDEIRNKLYKECKEIADSFNRMYSEDESYSCYLITLPENFKTYKDPLNERYAVYIENNIPSPFIQNLGLINRHFMKETK
jgi:hypothetical protein